MPSALNGSVRWQRHASPTPERAAARSPPTKKAACRFPALRVIGHCAKIYPGVCMYVRT